MKYIRSILIALLAFALLAALVLWGGIKTKAYAAEQYRTIQQTQAHEIAEAARAMGLPEDHVIITTAKALWWEDYGHEEDIRIMSRIIYNEAGCCTEEHQLCVGAVLMNRLVWSGFDDTIYECVVCPGQYHPGYASYDSKYSIPIARVAEFENLARRVIKGEPYDFPDNVVWQANFKQGIGVYKTFYSEVCNSYTYFCYG